jgi:hypothetical protein
VTLSPGVTNPFHMSCSGSWACPSSHIWTLPEESTDPYAGVSSYEGAAGAGGRIEMAISGHA